MLYYLVTNLRCCKSTRCGVQYIDMATTASEQDMLLPFPNAHKAPLAAVALHNRTDDDMPCVTCYEDLSGNRLLQAGHSRKNALHQRHTNMACLHV